jgi:hypothetical protein
MYYDSKVDMFATIDPNIAKKLPEKSLNKYRNYLDKGFVVHEDHSTGIKPLGDEAYEIKVFADKALYAMATDVLYTLPGKQV